MTVSRDHYYRLASEVPQERIEAATALLSELSKEQNKEEWEYALNRLIKGLTSLKQSARYGFSMALTELIRDLVMREEFDLTIESYLQRLTEASQVSNSMKGLQIRALLFGRLFGFQALINSNLLLDPKASSLKVLVNFVGALVHLSGMKSWLRETAMYSMCQFVTKYLESGFQDDETTVAFLQSICDEGLVFTTEGLAVYMSIPRQDLPRLCDHLRCSSQWKNGDPMTKGNLSTLAKVLKDAEVVDRLDDEENHDEENPAKLTKNGKQKGSWSSKIPFVWDHILAHFLRIADEETEDFVDSDESAKKRKKSSTKSKKKSKANAVELIALGEFWRVVIDDTMFSEKSSPERKYWGLDIFTKFLVKMPSSMVGCLLTPNLLRCLAANAKKSDKLLNKFSKKALNTVIKICHEDLSKIVPCLHAIIDEGAGNNWNLDSSTKIKVIDSLVGVLGHLDDPNSLPGHNAEDLVADIYKVLQLRYKSALKTQKELLLSDEPVRQKYSNDIILRWVLDKMILLFRSTKRLKSSPIKVMDDFVKFIIQQGYFKVVKGPTASQNIQETAHEKLNLFLADFILQKRKGHSWSLHCVNQLKKLEKNDELELTLHISGELASIRDKTMVTLNEIKQAMKGDSSKKDQLYCFELLFSMVLLQLYVGEAETVSVLEDLKVSYDSTFGEDTPDINSSEIITEIILSFISRKSGLLKKVSNIVWESFMCQNIGGELNVNEKCFERFFAILAASEDAQGQKNLFEGEEEYGASEETDNDESSDEGEKGSDDYSGDESDTAYGQSKHTSTKDEVEKETNIKLANALGINQYDGEVKFDDLDSFGDDDDKYESESMDDEQMMAIDEELSRIFKERHAALSANNQNKKRAEQVLAKDQVILFKNRVLDLMESFLKQQPNSLLGLSFIRPLVNVINLTKDKNVGVKAHKLLKTKVSKVKPSQEEIAAAYSSKEDIEYFTNKLLEDIKWLQDQAGTNSHNNAHGAACGQSCIIISKCLVSINKDYLKEIISIYAAAMTQWSMDSKNKLHASMFFEFVNWLNDKRGPK